MLILVYRYSHLLVKIKLCIVVVAVTKSMYMQTAISFFYLSHSIATWEPGLKSWSKYTCSEGQQ